LAGSGDSQDRRLNFAINTPNFGTFADPSAMVALAADAESAGWDGFFIWDHIYPGVDEAVSDPWVLLAVMAMVTTRIRLGPMVTPIPRRRPWKLARETVTLDHVSGGRLILGVGLGDDSMGEYSNFGEPVDARLHGEMLDEGLSVLKGLWSGRPFSFEGRHFQVKETVFRPAPLQTPQIPVWVAGRWPARKPFRRAAAWDGVVPVSRDGPLSPEECRQVAELVKRSREIDAPWDLAVIRPLESTRWEEMGEVAKSFADAGATWFQVGLSADQPLEEARQQIRLGPPRLPG
jgi:alkanesulfonate monooxygenase SsuD/methylene tetrahydromethanopterin reductase-like flavin-dependent oxidoreductase (luciferase family)